MKKILLSLICLTMALTASSQKLLDLYQKGTIKLVADNNFGQENDWDQVFRSYNDRMGSSHVGERKSLVIMPDGSVIVNHAYTDYYSKFNPQGKFLKEFGITGTTGKRFKKIMSIEGILNGTKFFTGLDNPGNMYFTDFNGKWLKTLKFKHAVRQVIALPNNKLAIVGWEIGESKFRDFISIIDYTTNKENVLWEYNTPRGQDWSHDKLFSYGYQFKSGGSIGYRTMPYINNSGMRNGPILSSVENKLIAAIPSIGEILIYDLNGNFKSKEKISWEQKYLSVEDQKGIQKKAIESIKTGNVIKASDKNTPEEIREVKEQFIKEMEADLLLIKDPIPIPTFSTILKDSDGNLLFFEFAEKQNENNFNVWVYEKGGKFVCQSRFVCDDYNLKINPSRMVFHNGYLYSLQEKKNASGVPMRLVRFKLTAN